MLRHLALALASLGLAAACSGPPASVTSGSGRSAAPPAGLVNRVWQVQASSDAEPASLYVFLSDGTLVMTSANTKPSLGAWSFHDGGLTMVEEGIPYKVEILELTHDTLKIRSHNPGQPVDITFGPADQAPPTVRRQ